MNYLLLQAKLAAENAYAPYSNFRVGAAVELNNHLIYTASNQECAAYGSCLCAERTALAYAVSTHPYEKVLRIAIYSPDSPEGISPCGECRQFIAEIAKRSRVDIEILGIGDGEVHHISDLLPHSFSLDKEEVDEE